MSGYPDGLDVRPLTTWPGQLTKNRRPAPFRAPMKSTLVTLTRELQHLAARHPVLEVAIPDGPDYWRIDGTPRARAWAEHPGVVLSLPTTNVGPLRYAADTFDEWQDNLRAIALGLEALRKVDRYGITRRGEQYAGFKALPSGATPTPAAGTMTADQAARVLKDLADSERGSFDVEVLLGSDEIRGRAFRRASARHHPDAGGDRAVWDQLEQAKAVLDQFGTGRYEA